MKLEEKHLEILEHNNTMCSDTNCCMNKSTIFYAQKSAELTVDVAVKFAEWLDDNLWVRHDDLNNWSRFLDETPIKIEYETKTTKELFEEFINMHYGK